MGSHPRRPREDVIQKNLIYFGAVNGFISTDSGKLNYYREPLARPPSRFPDWALPHSVAKEAT